MYPDLLFHIRNCVKYILSKRIVVIFLFNIYTMKTEDKDYICNLLAAFFSGMAVAFCIMTFLI